MWRDVDRRLRRWFVLVFYDRPVMATTGRDMWTGTRRTGVSERSRSGDLSVETRAHSWEGLPFSTQECRVHGL
jgi:hypothetical protein